MEWIYEYARKFRKANINYDNINVSIQEMVKSTNNMFKELGLEQTVEFDTNLRVITFPDCFISYSINSNMIEFNKTKRENSSSLILSGRIIFKEGLYSITGTGKLSNCREVFEDLESAIYKIMEGFLI